MCVGRLRRATAVRLFAPPSGQTPVSRKLARRRSKRGPGQSSEDEVLGQLGTQVKDESYLALDKPSPGAAGLGWDGFQALASSARSSPVSLEARRAPRREGRAGAQQRESETPSPMRPEDAAPPVRTGPRRSAGDLPAHGLVGQLAHAIELLLHLGAAAAQVGAGEGQTEPLESAAGLHGSREEPPGDSGGTAEPPAAAGPRLPPPDRTPPPTPCLASAPAAASSSCSATPSY